MARVSSAGLPWSTPRPSYPRHGWAIQPLTEMRLRESNYLRPGRASCEAISALRHTDRRPPSPDDWGRWRTPEVHRVPCLRRVQQACARCAYFIHAIEGHHLFIRRARVHDHLRCRHVSPPCVGVENPPDSSGGGRHVAPLAQRGRQRLMARAALPARPSEPALAGVYGESRFKSL